jgi:hypothetical protein
MNVVNLIAPLPSPTLVVKYGVAATVIEGRLPALFQKLEQRRTVMPLKHLNSRLSDRCDYADRV